MIDAALRPTVTELAKAKVKNAVTSIINDAVNETLSSEAISYGDLVTLEKDTAGQVTVLAANTAQLNALRTEILGRILEQVEQLLKKEEIVFPELAVLKKQNLKPETAGIEEV